MTPYVERCPKCGLEMPLYTSGFRVIAFCLACWLGAVPRPAVLKFAKLDKGTS